MIKFTNNAVSTLASSITNVQTSITLATGGGASFPTLSGTEYTYATIFQYGTSGEQNHEIVKVTARSSDTLTVVRAQDGTSARAFNAGDAVEIRITAVSQNNPNPQTVQYGMRAGFETINDLGSSGAAKTIPFDTYSLNKITLNNSSPALSLPTSNVWPGSYRLFLWQDATGNRVPTWPQVPAGNWASDTGTPQPQLTASKLTVYDFTYDGSNWYGAATPIGAT